MDRAVRGGHQIEVLTFETAFDSLDTERTGAPRLADFARDEAPRVIDAVFSEFCPPAEDIRLDRLDVVLPPGPATREGLADALRAALRDAVRRRGEASPAPPAAPHRSAELVELLHGLDHGWLPWPARLADAATADQRIARLLADDGPELIAGLLALADPQAALRRIARQWSVSNGRRLMAQLRDAGTAGDAQHDKRVGGLLALLDGELGEGSRDGMPSPTTAQPADGAAGGVGHGRGGSIERRQGMPADDRVAADRMLEDLFAALIERGPGDPVARGVARRVAGRSARFAAGDRTALLAELIAAVATADRVSPDITVARLVADWPRAGRPAVARLLAEALRTTIADRPWGDVAHPAAKTPPLAAAAADPTPLDRRVTRPTPPNAVAETAARDGRVLGRSMTTERRHGMPAGRVARDPLAAGSGDGAAASTDDARDADRQPLPTGAARTVAIAAHGRPSDPIASNGPAATARLEPGRATDAAAAPLARTLLRAAWPDGPDDARPDDPATLAWRLRELDTSDDTTAVLPDDPAALARRLRALDTLDDAAAARPADPATLGGRLHAPNTSDDATADLPARPATLTGRLRVLDTSDAATAGLPDDPAALALRLRALDTSDQATAAPPDDPAALARRLRALDTPASRQGFVAALDRAGWRALIALWVPADDVAAVAAIIDDEPPQAAPGETVAARDRQDWLLRLLLDSRRERITLAMVAAEWAVAAAAGRDVVATARDLAAMTAARPALASIGAALDDLATSLPTGPFDAAWLRALPPILPPFLRLALAAALGEPAAARTRLARLDEGQRAALVALASPFAGAAALAAADDCAAVAAAAGLPPPSHDARWQVLLDVVFGPVGGYRGGRDDEEEVAGPVDDASRSAGSLRAAIFAGWFDRHPAGGDNDQRRAALIAGIAELDDAGATGTVPDAADRDAESVIPRHDAGFAVPDHAVGPDAAAAASPGEQGPKDGMTTGRPTADRAAAVARLAECFAGPPTAARVAALLARPEAERRAAAIAAAPATAAATLALGDDLAAIAAQHGIEVDPAAHWRWVMAMLDGAVTPARQHRAWLALQLAQPAPAAASVPAPGDGPLPTLSAGRPPVIPAGRFTAAWVSTLPQPLPAATARAVAAALHPLPAAIERLADLPDGVRRRLLLAVEPAAAAAAFAIIDTLTAAAIAAGLPPAVVPTTGWHLVLAVFRRPRIDLATVAAGWATALTRAAAMLPMPADGDGLRAALDAARRTVTSRPEVTVTPTAVPSGAPGSAGVAPGGDGAAVRDTPGGAKDRPSDQAETMGPRRDTGPDAREVAAGRLAATHPPDYPTPAGNAPPTLVLGTAAPRDGAVPATSSQEGAPPTAPGPDRAATVLPGAATAGDAGWPDVALPARRAGISETATDPSSPVPRVTRSNTDAPNDRPLDTPAQVSTDRGLEQNALGSLAADGVAAGRAAAIRPLPGSLIPVNDAPQIAARPPERAHDGAAWAGGKPMDANLPVAPGADRDAPGSDRDAPGSDNGSSGSTREALTRPGEPDGGTTLPPSAIAGRAVDALVGPAADGWRAQRDALIAAGAAAFAGLSPLRQRQLLRQLGDDGSMAVDAADGLAALWRTAGFGAVDPSDVALLLFDEVVVRDRAFDPVRFAARWLAMMPAGASAGSVVATRARLARIVLPAPTRAVLDRAFAALGTGSALTSDRATGAGAAVDAPFPADAPVSDDTPIYVDNAGLVIVAAYIPPLFARLGLTHDGRFVDEAAAARGVHLLQTVVDGAADTLEPRLVLNKLLCGVALAVPVPRAIAVTADEAAAIDGLLRAIIANWRIIGNTSVAGLRESFLQRDGVLTADDTSWRLRVAPRSFDMLLDQLPWNFATIRLPWMDRVLHVDWR